MSVVGGLATRWPHSWCFWSRGLVAWLCGPLPGAVEVAIVLLHSLASEAFNIFCFECHLPLCLYSLKRVSLNYLTLCEHIF